MIIREENHIEYNSKGLSSYKLCETPSLVTLTTINYDKSGNVTGKKALATHNSDTVWFSETKNKYDAVGKLAYSILDECEIKRYTTKKNSFIDYFFYREEKFIAGQYGLNLKEWIHRGDTTMARDSIVYEKGQPSKIFGYSYANGNYRLLNEYKYDTFGRMVYKSEIAEKILTVNQVLSTERKITDIMFGPDGSRTETEMVEYPNWAIPTVVKTITRFDECGRVSLRTQVRNDEIISRDSMSYYSIYFPDLQQECSAKYSQGRTGCDSVANVYKDGKLVRTLVLMPGEKYSHTYYVYGGVKSDSITTVFVRSTDKTYNVTRQQRKWEKLASKNKYGELAHVSRRNAQGHLVENSLFQDEKQPAVRVFYDYEYFW
ncbi:MAG TPA: hypothetical protein VI731_00840 [Bacteroidia bacterium]|nr:hypothetical protein [Bacteroidia bacterium]